MYVSSIKFYRTHTKKKNFYLFPGVGPPWRVGPVDFPVHFIPSYLALIHVLLPLVVLLTTIVVKLTT